MSGYIGEVITAKFNITASQIKMILNCWKFLLSKHIK